MDYTSAYLLYKVSSAYLLPILPKVFGATGGASMGRWASQASLVVHGIYLSDQFKATAVPPEVGGIFVGQRAVGLGFHGLRYLA